MAALLAADARVALEKVGATLPTKFPEATPGGVRGQAARAVPAGARERVLLHRPRGGGRRVHRGRRRARPRAGRAVLRAERLRRHGPADPRSALARRRDRASRSRRDRRGQADAGRPRARGARGARREAGVHLPRDADEPGATGPRLRRADHRRARVREALGQEGADHRRHHARAALPDLRKGARAGLAVRARQERLEVLHQGQGHARRRGVRERSDRDGDRRARPRARSGRGLVRAAGAARGAQRRG